MGFTQEQVEKVLRQEGIDPSDKERVKYIAERATDLKKIDDELNHELQNAQENFLKKAQNLNFNPELAIAVMAETMMNMTKAAFMAGFQTFLESSKKH